MKTVESKFESGVSDAVSKPEGVAFIKGSGPLRGQPNLPGDKSISHRTAILSSLCQGPVSIRGFSQGADCLTTLRCLRELGVSITATGSGRLQVKGVGLQGWTRPKAQLDAGNSGTTVRLLTGALARCSFRVGLTGDESLQKRPMGRVILPLREMGAGIDAHHDLTAIEGGDPLRLPLTIQGGVLKGIAYNMPVASAQVKSAILLAGLGATGPPAVVEPAPSRDHTERLLRFLGVDVEVQQSRDCDGITVKMNPPQPGALRLPKGVKALTVPGDVSAAMFYIAAALVVPGSLVSINNVGLNPTRTGALEALRRMGANLSISNLRTVSGEPVGDIEVKSGTLRGIELSGHIIPSLIDEIPILALLATQAQGTTVIRDAAELRVKETDRIAAMVRELSGLGASLQETEDGLIIEGKGALCGGSANSWGDHRIAMTLAVAGLCSADGVELHGSRWVGISDPGFFSNLEALGAQCSVRAGDGQ